MSDEKVKKPVPTWAKLVIAAGIGGGAVSGGEKLAKDSPVHFMVEGEAPAQAMEWACEPEGGIIGAPVVCRYKLALPKKPELENGTSTQVR